MDFSNIMGKLVDKEQLTFDTIQSCLEDIAEELGCSYKDFFVMIKPINANFKMVYMIYKEVPNELPKFVREISLKEILGE